MENLIFKVRFLFFLSVGLAVLASTVHIYIIYSTYQMARENYVKEIGNKMQSFSMVAAVSSVNITAIDHIKLLMQQYGNKKISRQTLHQEIKQIHFSDKNKADSLIRYSLNKFPQLSSTRYSSKFTQVQIDVNGLKDTIRFDKEKLFGAAGKQFKSLFKFRM